MQINFCKNHREEIAHYRCYYCKQSICAKCRHNLSHHYFCSYRCYYLYLGDLFTAHFKSHWKEWLLAIQFIAILLLIIVATKQGDKLVRLNQQLTELNQIVDTLAATPGNPDDHTRIQNFAVRQRGRQLTLGFPAVAGSIFLTWINGKIVPSQIREKGDSLFINLSLPQPNNSVTALAISPEEGVLSRFSRIFSFPQYRLRQNLSVSRGPTDQQALALTFDGGSDSRHTKEILQILRDNNLKCTLFLTGKFIQQNPNLVRTMVADGHEIGNHTYSHPHFTTYAENRRHNLRKGIDSLFVTRQLLKTDSVFFAVSGQHLLPYWRAPYGEYNDDILRWAAAAGYRHVRWSRGFDTYDWVTDESSRLFRTPRQIFDHFQTQDRRQPAGLNGVIVLMHLGSQRNGNHVFQALPELISYLRQRGYKISKISELLQTGA